MENIANLSLHDNDNQGNNYLEFLPQEIYEKIYNFLPVEDVKNMFLVSRTTFSQISSSRFLMKKLRFYVSMDPDQHYSIMELEKDEMMIKHLSLEAIYDGKYADSWIEVFVLTMKKNPQVERISIKGSDVPLENDDFDEAINSLTQLKELEIVSYRLRGELHDFNLTGFGKTWNLKNLEKLILESPRKTVIYQKINCDSLKVINVTDYFSHLGFAQYFFKKQTKLESFSLQIKLDSLKDNLFISNLLSCVPTSIKKLDIQLYDYFSPLGDSLALTFTGDKYLYDCKLTLEEVHITYPNMTVLKVLVNECPKLKKLSIRFHSDSFDEIKELKPNNCVESLTILEKFTHLKNPEIKKNHKIFKFIETFINLKHLTFEGNLFRNETASDVLTLTNSKLETIYINAIAMRNFYFSELELKNLRFPNVKNLTILNSPPNNWLHLAQTFPIVEVLRFKYEKKRFLENVYYNIDELDIFIKKHWKSVKKFSSEKI